MSGKRLLDAAALYKATRGVASKHAALRTRQLDAYKKTSSLAQAVASQTGRIASSTKAATSLAGRPHRSGHDYSVQASPDAPKTEPAQIPSHESVSTPENAPIPKEGLQQDHFYERSEQNSTTQPPPNSDIGIQQEAATRYPLPDGSIPPVGSGLDASSLNQESYSDLPQTEPVKQPLSNSGRRPEEKLEPASSGQSTIPEPSDEYNLPAPEDARKLQRQAGKPIPSQAAEPPPVAASNVNAAGNEHAEDAELGVDQGQDVFYTASPNTSRDLSAFPRVKLPKNTVDGQHSAEPVSDERINQDVFYTSLSDGQKQAVPEQQAVPQQDEPSEDTYSELFHSSKVAKMLKGKPNPVDPLKGLGLKAATGTPIEDDRATPVGDPESFNARLTQEEKTPAGKAQGTQDRPTLPDSSHQDDIQTLAADIAKDATEAPSSKHEVRQTDLHMSHHTDWLTVPSCR